MNYEEWADKVKDFKVIDVRKITGNFFPGLKAQAEKMNVGEGFVIIQSFRPFPLYMAMKKLGFEHHTDKVSSNEFRVAFYRVTKKDEPDDAPFKPLALMNYPLIDEELGQITADFWNLTWQSERRTIPYKMRLLLSLTNAVGAGRLRQACRELIKAYHAGVTSAELDDVFELLVWNQGVGHFSSEIGPSALFQAYKLIKQQEKLGKSHEEICAMLKEKFGEKNAEVSVLNN